MDKSGKEKALVSKKNNQQLTKVAEITKVSMSDLNTGVGISRFSALVAVSALQGTVTPGAANASLSAVTKILRVLELRHRFGKKSVGPDFTIE